MPSDVEVRVWDSSAEVRYLVLPQRPLRYWATRSWPFSLLEFWQQTRTPDPDAFELL